MDSGVHLGCLSTFKKVFFYTEKVFFLLLLAPPILHVVQAADLETGLPGAAASLARIVVKKPFLCKKKHFSGFKPASGVHLGCLRTFKKVFFYNRKCFFLLLPAPHILHVVQAAGLETGVPGAAASLALIVVKKNILCCKKTHFSGFKPASGVHLGCLRNFKNVFFYNRKGFFLLLLAPPSCRWSKLQASRRVCLGLQPAWHAL